jgi:hypothetical protein
MKNGYDFSKGKRGRVLAEPPPEPGKVRITIRLDEDLLDFSVRSPIGLAVKSAIKR